MKSAGLSLVAFISILIHSAGAHVVHGKVGLGFLLIMERQHDLCLASSKSPFPLPPPLPLPLPQSLETMNQSCQNILKTLLLMGDPCRRFQHSVPIPTNNSTRSCQGHFHTFTLFCLLQSRSEAIGRGHRIECGKSRNSRIHLYF